MPSRPNDEMEKLEGDESEGPHVSAEHAGYMELPGAIKDAGCRLVKVEGGVSRALGCCNLFDYDGKGPKQFRCGTCEYVCAKHKE